MASGPTSRNRMLATIDGSRWFHVPRDVSFVEGPLEVRDLLGRRSKVDPAAIAAHEVDGETAKALTRVEVVDLLGMAKAGLESLKSLVPPDRPEGAAGLDAMTGVVDKLVTGLRKTGDPTPAKWAPEDLKARLEGFLREVASDPSKAGKLEELAKGLEKQSAAVAERTRELREKNES